MNIIIGDRTRKYMDTLGIVDFPFSEQLIKSNFRQLALKYHPDINKTVEAEKKFIRIKEAYDAIINLATCVTQEDIEIELKNQKDKEEDIFALYNECELCKGTGKVLERQTIYEPIDPSAKHKPQPCILCRKVRCPKCDKGEFTLRSGRKVTCLHCEGSGVLPDRKCSWCLGRGTRPRSKVSYKTVFVNCSNCNGTGKIEVKPFNPVIPKGAIMV